MVNYDFFIKKTIAYAENCPIQPYRFGAIITFKDRILCYGSNSYVKTHPDMIFHSNYHNDIHNHNKNFIHAEIQVCNTFENILFGLRNNQKNKIIRKTLLYIANIRKDEKISIAKPCNVCISKIKSIGIKKIIYTILNKDENKINYIVEEI